MQPQREQQAAEIAALKAQLAERERTLQQQIEEQRRILDSILDSSGEGIAVADLHGRFLAFNAAARTILKMGPADVDPDHWSSTYGLFRPDGVTMFPAHELPLARAMNGEELDEVEILVRHGDLPQGRRIRVTARPLRDADGVIGGGVAIFRDVTIQSRLEEELRQAQKMEALGRFAGGIAHDFNNLLMGITGCCTIGQRLLPDHHDARHYIAEISDAVQRGVALSRQLLDFSRNRPVEYKTLRIDSVIRRAEAIMRRLLDDDIELETHCTGTGGPVRGDRGQLEQILFNLVVNARDAIDGNGKITIRAQETSLADDDRKRPATLPPGAYVVLTVTDSGRGMPQEVIDRAFDPFFTTKEPGQGTGLGLSTVYGFVRQMSGHIAIESTLGRGTTVCIHLPRSQEPASDSSVMQIANLTRGGSETVLLVEDDDLVRRTIHENVRSLDYRVLEAARPSTALRLVEENDRIDLLLTDVLMPEMSGGELARRIRALRPELKVLYMSAWPHSVLRERSLLEDDAVVLQKPFQDQTLAAAIRELLDDKT